VVSTEPDAGKAVVRVRDTGIGMEAKTLAGLFQPFLQADSSLDRSKGGVGLGLALVRGLVELHGGEVAATSEGLGMGSELIVRLPLATTDAAAPRVTSPSPPRRSRRVLVIEDNADAAASLQLLLTLEGHAAAVAQNGPDGLALALEFRPEVLLCDIGLPEMDGYEVARAFRSNPALAGTYLIALTGYGLPEDVQRSMEAGFDRHLTKPPSLERLNQMLASAPDTPGGDAAPR
jgi:two-component system CheB/CheR fusion protein